MTKIETAAVIETKPMTKMTVAELRELALKRGLSTTTKLTRKADLIGAIEKMATATTQLAEWDAAKAAPAAPAAPAAAKNRCTVCGVRPIGSGIGDEDKRQLRTLQMCNPCATEGGWMNTHSDAGHETIDALTVRNSSFKTKAALEEWKAQERKVMERCWICHPELDASSADYVAREGTSREGMVVHARGGISGKVACLQEAGKAAGGNVVVKEETVTRGKGKDKEDVVVSTTLVWRSRIGAELTVVWDHAGRFQYGPSVAVGRISEDTPAKEAPRKIRNVAEALRFIATPA